MPIIQQLPLELGSGHQTHSFDTFIKGDNIELVALLKALTEISLSSLPSRMIYIWGDSESGKTHLLQSVHYKIIQVINSSKKNNCTSIYLNLNSKIEQFECIHKPCIYCVDDIHLMSTEKQIAVFVLINEIRNDVHSAIITAGNAAPKNLLMREDVRTRMGWGLVYELHSLATQDKKQALIQNAHSRGINLTMRVADWLLSHSYTDMNSLIDILNALDLYSLQQKKPVSLFMLKRMLQEWAA
jgi:DnaA-homolog protein